MPAQYSPHEARTIQRALALLERSMRAPDTPVFDGVLATKQYLRLRFAGVDREEMHALYLDGTHALVASEVVSLGTLNQCPVYAREVARSALRHNAAAVILAHNHPSGSPQPTAADRHISAHMEFILASIDVRLLDHLVVTTAEIRSAHTGGVL